MVGKKIYKALKKERSCLRLWGILMIHKVPCVRFSSFQFAEQYQSRCFSRAALVVSYSLLFWSTASSWLIRCRETGVASTFRMEGEGWRSREADSLRQFNGAVRITPHPRLSLFLQHHHLLWHPQGFRLRTQDIFPWTTIALHLWKLHLWMPAARLPPAPPLLPIPPMPLFTFTPSGSSPVVTNRYWECIWLQWVVRPVT